MNIQVFENPTGYYVVIGKYVYEMNKNADQPNGVCIYQGLKEHFLLSFRQDRKSDYLAEADLVPVGIVRQVMNIISGLEMLKPGRVPTGAGKEWSNIGE